MMPTTKGSSKPRSRSLYENSAAIAVNLVKASSIVLATMALGPPQSSSAAPANRNRSCDILHVEAPAPSPAAAAAADHHHQKDSRRPVAAAAAPMSHPAKSYLQEPDERAEEYIRMVRERHFSDPTASSADLENCIPPPPLPAIRKWSTHSFGR